MALIEPYLIFIIAEAYAVDRVLWPQYDIQTSLPYCLISSCPHAAIDTDLAGPERPFAANAIATRVFISIADISESNVWPGLEQQFSLSCCQVLSALKLQPSHR